MWWRVDTSPRVSQIETRESGGSARVRCPPSASTHPPPSPRGTVRSDCATLHPRPSVPRRRGAVVRRSSRRRPRPTHPPPREPPFLPPLPRRSASIDAVRNGRLGVYRRNLSSPPGGTLESSPRPSLRSVGVPRPQPQFSIQFFISPWRGSRCPSRPSFSTCSPGPEG